MLLPIDDGSRNTAWLYYVSSLFVWVIAARLEFADFDPNATAVASLIVIPVIVSLLVIYVDYEITKNRNTKDVGNLSTGSIKSEKTEMCDPSPIEKSETLYSDIAQEIDSGKYDEGLWARLYAETDGDEAKTKARYIKERYSRESKRKNVDDQTRLRPSGKYGNCENCGYEINQPTVTLCPKCYRTIQR